MEGGEGAVVFSFVFVDGFDEFFFVLGVVGAHV